ncbi:unnamed protein product [Rotaria sp. Silwood2]|nr:unnamed protein product [Rotaria sp. Silwood2]CAF4488221.1 unnamed protein product [Rotaria sp. Silwood2]CAF4810227.1 unnamed protein product [Rotaria sp. Silwood2]
MHKEQFCHLNDNLIQTEATFHRVSRELKQARSKSRSRSRSILLRQRENKSISSFIQHKTQSIDHTQNKDHLTYFIDYNYISF